MTPAATTAVVDRLRAAGCVFAEEEAAVLIDAADDAAHLEDMVRQRIEGLPLEHVVGWAELCGMRVVVEPGVFVPRRRSELLVAQAIAAARPASIVVDLCCGSGAIGAAVLAARADIELHAADIDPAAVHCARRNIPTARGAVHEGDLYNALPRPLAGRVDVLVVNAPYVPTDAIELLPAEARLHEAPIALDGGGDGLDVQRRVVDAAASWLRPGGVLLIETSDAQSERTASLFAVHGFEATVVRSDDLDATVVVGRLSGGHSTTER